ncbi:MAG: hypothetical protein U0271_31625 [Polyangiaceae bacterium]
MGKAQWKEQTPSSGVLTITPGAELAVKAERGSVRFRDGALELEASLGVGETDGDQLTLIHSLDETPCFVPHLTPEPGDVASDFVFRAPAIVLKNSACVVALVPDLDDVAALHRENAASQGELHAFLDLDAPNKRLAYGVGGVRVKGHTFFERASTTGRSGVKVRLHVLSSRTQADQKNPFRMVARWLWARWGRPLHEKGGSHRAPYASSIAHLLNWSLSKDGWAIWQDVDADRGAPVFIVDVTRHPSVPEADRRWREPRSIWNQAWFSTQRCANGLLRYAKRLGDEQIAERARAMTRLTLSAPQNNGLFPSVLTLNHAPPEAPWSEARWTNSDRRPSSASEHAVHLVDAAFTCRMLLEWAALSSPGEILAKEQPILDRVIRFADRVLTLQSPEPPYGFPAWVEPDGRIHPELANGPESAVVAQLLLELTGLTANPKYQVAGLAAAAGLHDLVLQSRWEDFETYYSCAPWGRDELFGRRVPRNGVFKQNTLSMAWTVEALLTAYEQLRGMDAISRAPARRSAGDGGPSPLASLDASSRRHLEMAEAACDQLSLYQAVWDPPFLPIPAHGGFGVMNGDCEWNDARQSLFAPVYFRMSEALRGRGRDSTAKEYWERGVAALRASFTMLYSPDNPEAKRAYEARFPIFGAESYGFMMENQGHGGSGALGDFTIFTWGPGSALATAELIRERYPSACLADWAPR